MSGQLYLFHSNPRDTRTFNWKKDKLNYVMRKNQKSFQENRQFLKINGKDEIVYLSSIGLDF